MKQRMIIASLGILFLALVFQKANSEIAPIEFSNGIFISTEIKPIGFYDGPYNSPKTTFGMYLLDFKAGSVLPEQLTGQRVHIQWQQVNPAPGVYDFSEMDAEIKNYISQGYCVSIRLNGNRKPEWMFDKIPYHPTQMHVQVNDPKGTLAYWDPIFIQTYMEVIEEYAKYIKSLPQETRAMIAGIRLNFNSIGTEQWDITQEAEDYNTWIVPKGATPPIPLTKAMKSAYRAQVVDKFVECFVPDVPVFCRTNVEEDVFEKYRRLFEEGKFGWFHTGAGMEQTQIFNQTHRYQPFLDFCKTGKTFGFTESAAPGNNNVKVVLEAAGYNHTQYHYWQLLSNLHCGISHIAMFNRVYADYEPGNVEDLTLSIGDKYAGYHAKPLEARGAWVALRKEGDGFKGDYTYLMKRVPDESVGVQLKKVGEPNSAFGVWTLAIAENEVLHFDVNDRLFNGGGDVKLQLRYFDEGNSALGIYYTGDSANQKAGEIAMKGTNTWHFAAVPLKDAHFDNRSREKSDLYLKNEGKSRIILHFVEVTK